MPTSPSKQLLRKKRREAGLCLHCGKPAIRAKPGGKYATLTYCEKCQKGHAASYVKISARNESLGVCRNVGCHNKTEPDRKYCSDCNKKSGSRTAKRRELRVMAGFCGQCGEKPRLPDHTRCQECLDAMHASIARLVEARVAREICGRCGENPVGKGRNKLCDICVRTNRGYQTSLKRIVLEAYGGPVCVGCDDDTFEILQLDHINGGGHAHALELGDGDANKGRSKMYRHLRDEGFPSGYRVLCPTCNIKALRGILLPNQIKRNRRRDLTPIP